MRLVNLLKLPGGIPEQGREITLKAVRYRGAGGVPEARDVTVVLMPLSEVEMGQVERQARELAAAKDAALQEAEELVIQLLAASARAPDNLAEYFFADEADRAALRAGLVAPHYQWILDEYKTLMADEYGRMGEEEVKKLEQEAEGFSSSDQPARG